jgi:hypothetical protein
MIDQSTAHPAHTSTPEPTPAYVLRGGLGISEFHRDRLLES